MEKRNEGLILTFTLEKKDVLVKNYIGDYIHMYPGEQNSVQGALVIRFAIHNIMRTI